MPNGYTSALYEGKDESLEEFISNCARGMGMFMHMRDESSSTALHYPSENWFSLDYSNRLNDSREELKAWQSKSEEDKYFEWSNYYADKLVEKAEAKAKSAEMSARYYKRIAEIQAIKVPILMESFKEFMLKTLNESREFDCSSDDFIEKYYTPEEYVEWCASTTKSLFRSVAFYEGEVEKQNTRHAEFDEYLNAFVDTFGIEVKGKP